METDFLTAFNKKQKQQAEDLDQVIKPYVCDPSFLPLVQREELIYKFSYLEETIEGLAQFYRLSPNKLKEWLHVNRIERKELDEDFEKDVTEIYTSIQTRLLGLTVLHSAKAWETLANIEDNVLQGLENASVSVSQQKSPDHRTLASLASTHEKIVNRHVIIQEGLSKAKDTEGLFRAITRVERVIVDGDT